MPNYKFLIYISYSYSLSIGKPLEAEINKRGFEVMWFADRPEGMNKIKNADNVLSKIQQVVDYKPDVVLVATNVVPDFISGIKVQIFHGFNAQKRHSKKNQFSHFNIRGFFDLYCTQGPSTTEYFNKLASKYKHFKVVETGWSKVDSLFPVQPRLNKIEKIKTILIASTFSKRLSLAQNPEIFDEIFRLTKTKKYHFLLVLHPKTPDDIVRKWKNLECDLFTYYNTTNLNPLCKRADLLLADTTSVIQEFILQKKPVVAFANNTKPDYLINIDNVDSLENALDLKVLNLEDIQQNINRFIQQLHPYTDGQSSQRVIDACLTFLHEDKSYLSAKPLNLLRKFKIRKQLKYFTFKSYNKP